MVICEGADVAQGAISSRLDLPLDVPAEGYRVIKYPFWTADFMEFYWKYALVASPDVPLLQRKSSAILKNYYPFLLLFVSRLKNTFLYVSTQI